MSITAERKQALIVEHPGSAGLGLKGRSPFSIEHILKGSLGPAAQQPSAELVPRKLAFVHNSDAHSFRA